MKTTFFIFTLSLLATSNIYAQAPSDFRPDIQIYDGKGDYGRLAASIDMRYMVVRAVLPAKGLYVYRKNGGRWLALDSSIESVNLFLTDAVESANAKSFLDQYLVELLLATMTARQSSVIDDKFIFLYRGLENYGGMEETIKKLKALISNPKPTFVGDKWQIFANIGTFHGGVERWEIEGTLLPLQITSIKRVLIHPPGWYQVLDDV